MRLAIGLLRLLMFGCCSIVTSIANGYGGGGGEGAALAGAAAAACEISPVAVAMQLVGSLAIGHRAIERSTCETVAKPFAASATLAR